MPFYGAKHALLRCYIYPFPMLYMPFYGAKGDIWEKCKDIFPIYFIPNAVLMRIIISS